MEQKTKFAGFSLEGKRALVTGAGQGIGRSLGLGLIEAGAEVCFTDHDSSLAEKAAREASDMGAKAHGEFLDVTDLKSIESGFEKCVKLMGGLDILVNNAGIEQVCDSLSVDEALWDRIINVNLKGAFFCAQTAGRLMTDQGSGSIVNLCSLTSFVGVPTATPYTSSKSGILGMTRALSSEWADKGVRVNGIAPGYFRTQLTDVFYEDKEWRESMQSKIPMGRFGKMNDLIGSVIFFCSEASSYVTGQVIVIDGGYLSAL